MKKLCTFVFVLIQLALSAQGDSTSKSRRSLNCGPEITLGPEVLLLYPNLITTDIELRYWIRVINWDKRRTFDHTLLVSPGFTYGRNESLFRLRLGDLIDIPIGAPSVHRHFRFGVNTELLTNSVNRIWSIQGHFGFRNRQLYYYVGISHPFSSTKADVPLRTNMMIGVKYYIFQRYNFIN